MIAVVELISALFLALIELFTNLVLLVSNLVVMILEIVFVSMSRGLSAAKSRYHDRAQQLRLKPEANAINQPANASHQRIVKKQIFTGVIGFSAIICIVLAIIRSEHIQQNRIDLTKQLINHKAKDLAGVKSKGVVQLPQPGLLQECDAWGRPLELLIDDFAGCSLIVVRSQGRDGKAGTIDDLLAIELSNPNAANIGNEMVKLGIDKVEELFKRKRK